MATTHPNIPSAAIEALRSRTHGAVLQSGDALYDEFRQVWNGTIDRHPAVIVRCAHTSDVSEAVRFAREHGLPISVCGGGHNVAGFAVQDGALMIDLRDLNAVSVDPQARTVRAQGGARWADVDRATVPYGLGVPGGVVSDTGIAGLTLGGGFGWLSSKYGLSADNVRSFEVVTAEGKTVRASEHQNPDLYWALRGGGGNFGIVTTFEYQAHPIEQEVVVCFVAFPAAEGPRALRFARDYMAENDGNLVMIAFFGTVPEAEAFPEAIHGEPFLGFLTVWLGDHTEGQRVTQPLREIATPLFDFSGIYPWTETQALLDEDYPTGGRYYWKSAYIDRLDDEVIDALAALATRMPSGASTIDVWMLGDGGAVSRVPDSATAFAHRGAPFGIGIEANWTDPADDGANIAWARDVFDAMQPFSYRGGAYINFPGDGESDNVVRAAYGDNFSRLVEVKRTWDPDNVFAANANIRP